VVALCVFPWSYATGNMLLTWGSLQASAQGPVIAWYSSNIFGLFLIPLALGTIYYLTPKITGASIYSYYLTLLGFFSLLLLTGWSGMTMFLGGPIPVWMVSASVVTTILMIIPVAAVILNFVKMLQGQCSVVKESPSLRFVVFGIISYVIITILHLIYALPTFNGIFHFTNYSNGVMLLTLLGVVSMVFFAGIYYIVPRLLGFSWLCTCSIRCHFWLSVVGLSLMLISAVLGGLIEGIALDDAAVTFVNVLSFASPWRWLDVIAWILLLLSYFSFIKLFVRMLFHCTHPDQKSLDYSFNPIASAS
jgi:cytochrome c oxidase cbb3-type subunit 1